jgi:hypothetical protein
MPGLAVCMGGMVCCDMSMPPEVPVPILPTSAPTVIMGDGPAATIMDFAEDAIPTFGMCMSEANPEVAAATAAALGVLTPMPCVPVLTPWDPGADTVIVGEFPALTESDTSQCAYGGTITVVFPGQVVVTIT